VFIVMIALLIHLSSGIRSFPPTSLGKVTTATQLLTVGVVLLANAINQPLPILVAGLGWITMAMTVSSGLHYIYHAARLAESASSAPQG
jgi:phosphatidylglycerophosphate synthase